MKKIGFVMQLATLIIALPSLTILELNHVNAKAAIKKTDGYIMASGTKAGALAGSAIAKMPS